MSFASYLKVFGVKLQNVDIKVDKADVQVSLLVDDQSLRSMLNIIPTLLPQ